MTDDDYTKASVRSWVLSGFYTPDDVREMVYDILEESDDEDEILGYIDQQVERRDAEEAEWPRETDCDRLDRALEVIEKSKIVVLQNAGETMSDGHADVSEALEPHPTGTFKGYCFYHGQDVERVVQSGDLYLAFGDLRDTTEGKLAVGKLIRDTLVKAGFDCEWNENVSSRILIKGLDWKRRRPRD